MGILSVPIAIGGQDILSRVEMGNVGLYLTKKQPPETYIPQAEAIEMAVNIPVIAVGRINSPRLAEAIISQSKADLVAIGRQLIADPQWARKRGKADIAT